MILFKVNGLEFDSNDFLDDISEFEDIIPIIQELQENLSAEEISCVGKNDCCDKTDKNYIVEIEGFINENDEFVTKEEITSGQNDVVSSALDIFVIRVYKCVECGKWIIDILE